MPGVYIGKRYVIGAGAGVTKDNPDESVAVGISAKAIMTTKEYAEKCLANQHEYNEEAYLRDKEKYLVDWIKDL